MQSRAAATEIGCAIHSVAAARLWRTQDLFSVGCAHRYIPAPLRGEMPHGLPNVCGIGVICGHRPSVGPGIDITAALEWSRGGSMITDDKQLETTLERINWFQEQVTHLRRTETNPVNYHASVSGFLMEIDRMQLEVREYLSMHPSELAEAT